MRASDLAVIAIQYLLRVDSTDLSGFQVEMRIRGAADAFVIAMNAHPEYDDKYWRYLRDIRVEGSRPGARVVRTDSALWQVTLPGGDGVIRYRIVFPTPAESPRAAWHPFLSPTGGLLGGPHAFLYLPGHEKVATRVSLDLPGSWRVVSSLPVNGSERELLARDVETLVEAPIFAGRYSSWQFVTDGVAHRVIYWRAPGAAAFDSVAFVRGLEGIALEASRLFGGIPWKEYTFIFQDSAYGGLEHATSATLGAPSADLARDPQAHLPEAAHEFIHAWNLMRLRPIEYRTVDSRPQPPVAGLWFSEGLTIFYADLLMRRAGLPVDDSTRVAHLAHLLTRYLNQPGSGKLPAERVSRSQYSDDPAELGDYVASSHLQGELLGAMLDFIIRDSTDGARTMDDVMRVMYQRFPPGRGYTGADVEQAVEQVCDCDVTGFFEAHIRGGSPIDYQRYMARLALVATVSDTTPRDRNDKPAPDVGIWVWNDRADGSVRIRISRPDNVWGRAGLHTGDRLVSLNGEAIASWPEFRLRAREFRVGDTVRVEVLRGTARQTVAVVVQPLEQKVVRVEADPAAAARARRLLSAWEQGR